MKHVTVYHEPGRFAAWPANNGVWGWGNEIVVGFQCAYYKENPVKHSYDKERPVTVMLARSTDGGETWRVDDGEALNAEDAVPVPCPGNIRFTHPDFAMRCRNNSFHISYDRCRTWQGPYALPDIGNKWSSRTDYLAIGPQHGLLLLSVKLPKSEHELQHHKDRAVCLQTTDGGASFEFLSYMTTADSPERSVMPSTVRGSRGQLISALRRRLDTKERHYNWIDAVQSEDNGRTWDFLGKIADTDQRKRNGNPPALVRLNDGRLCAAYGYRETPYGIRARISSDEGETWGPEIYLRTDARTWDSGYPRMVQRPDGQLVIIYYYTTEACPEQHIAATMWNPDSVSNRL